MDTNAYINCLRSKKHDIVDVSMRQALCYYLYKQNISCVLIAKLIGCTRRNVYMRVYRTIDLLETGDKYIKAALAEIDNHKINIKPCTVDGDLLSRHTGYKMIIDNIIL
jgi:hypothetical protein